MSEFRSNREANRLFCAWRETRGIAELRAVARALRFAVKRTSGASRANFLRALDCR